MEEIKSEYCKRSQKNYSMSFKLSVVCEIERGTLLATTVKKEVWYTRRSDSYQLVEKT